MDCLEVFASVFRLCLNPDKTAWMCKNAWTSMELLMHDFDFKRVSHVKYLGVLMGEVSSDKAYAVPLATAGHRARGCSITGRESTSQISATQTMGSSRVVPCGMHVLALHVADFILQ